MTDAFGLPKHLVFLLLLAVGDIGCVDVSIPVEDPDASETGSLEFSTGDQAPTTGVEPPTDAETPSTTEYSSSGEDGAASDEGDLLASTGVTEMLCGNGVLNEGEACDDGIESNTLDGGCLPDCTLATCGDGFVNAGVEDCDMGTENGFDYGQCNKLTCKWGPRCGDGQVDAPDEVCDPGDPNGQADGVGCDVDCRLLGRIVFLTSEGYDGNLGGLEGADTLCQSLAATFDNKNAMNYRAWLSDSMGSPYLRFVHELKGDPNQVPVPYVMRNGIEVASSFGELVVSGPFPGIYLTETDQVLEGREVWTNTDRDGHSLKSGDCNGWTSVDGEATYGVTWVSESSPDHRSWVSKGYWTRVAPGSCSHKRRLYCFEN